MLPPQNEDPTVAAPRRTPLSPLSNDDRGLRLVQGELSPRSYGNHLLQHPGNRSVASPSTSNHRPRWQTWPVGMLKGRRLQFAGTLRHHLTILERRKSAHTPWQKLTLPVIKSKQSVEALLPLISNSNLSREPCRPYTTINMRLERPEKLPDKACRSPHYRPTVTCLESGRWRGLQFPTSKLTALSVHSSGGG